MSNLRSLPTRANTQGKRAISKRNRPTANPGRDTGTPRYQTRSITATRARHLQSVAASAVPAKDRIREFWLKYDKHRIQIGDLPFIHPGPQLFARANAEEADWLAKRVWGAAVSWLDARLKFVEETADKVLVAASKRKSVMTEEDLANPPVNHKARINDRVHGGNIGDDAMMIKLGYPVASVEKLFANVSGYKMYMERNFALAYGGLSVDDAYWLARKGDENNGISHNIDWRYCIGLIDAYVLLRDLVLPIPDGKAAKVAALKLEYEEAARHFTTLVKKNLETFIRSAKRNPGWNATNANLTALDAACTAVEQGMDPTLYIGNPRHPSTYTSGISAWSDFDLQNRFRAWKPSSDYLAPLRPMDKLANRCAPVPPPAQ